MKQRKPSITAVAELAGVAQSTVSRVINGGYASQEMKRRVERAMAKLDYAPSTTAQNFAAGRAGAIGLVVEDIRGEWLTEILSGIEGEIRDKKTSLLIGSVGADERYDATQVQRWIEERRVDGLIFVRPTKRDVSLVQAARKAHLGVALIGPDHDFSYGKPLTATNIEGGRDVARHLAALGHRDIAYVGGPKNSTDARHRLKGLQQGLEEVGIEVSPEHIKFAPHYNVDEGRTYASEWLRMRRRPTAVVFGNDAMALGFMNVALSQGISIPDDLSVVGFDDIAAASFVWPRLTTVRQEASKLGAGAIRTVLRQLSSPDQESRKPEEYGTALIVRESTGRPPGGRTKERS